MNGSQIVFLRHTALFCMCVCNESSNFRCNFNWYRHSNFPLPKSIWSEITALECISNTHTYTRLNSIEKFVTSILYSLCCTISHWFLLFYTQYRFVWNTSPAGIITESHRYIIDTRNRNDLIFVKITFAKHKLLIFFSWEKVFLLSLSCTMVKNRSRKTESVAKERKRS